MASKRRSVWVVEMDNGTADWVTLTVWYGLGSRQAARDSVRRMRAREKRCKSSCVVYRVAEYERAERKRRVRK